MANTFYDPVASVGGQFSGPDSSCPVVPFTQLQNTRQSGIYGMFPRCYFRNYGTVAVQRAATACPSVVPQFENALATVPDKDLTIEQANASMAAFKAACDACGTARGVVLPHGGGTAPTSGASGGGIAKYVIPVGIIAAAWWLWKKLV